MSEFSSVFVFSISVENISSTSFPSLVFLELNLASSKSVSIRFSNSSVSSLGIPALVRMS